MFEKEGFNTWFKETFQKEDCLNNTVFTRQFLMDAWSNGYNNAKDYAKTIIQDLLSNSDEYARQRAMDWLKGE